MKGMNIRDEKSKVNLESTVSENPCKKEWNTPDIKIVTPIKKTANGMNLGGAEAGGYATGTS